MKLVPRGFVLYLFFLVRRVFKVVFGCLGFDNMAGPEKLAFGNEERRLCVQGLWLHYI